jgi:hypothetical protein
LFRSSAGITFRHGYGAREDAADVARGSIARNRLARGGTVRLNGAFAVVADNDFGSGTILLESGHVNAGGNPNWRQAASYEWLVSNRCARILVGNLTSNGYRLDEREGGRVRGVRVCHAGSGRRPALELKAPALAHALDEEVPGYRLLASRPAGWPAEQEAVTEEALQGKIGWKAAPAVA